MYTDWVNHAAAQKFFADLKVPAAWVKILSAGDMGQVEAVINAHGQKVIKGEDRLVDLLLRCAVDHPFNKDDVVLENRLVHYIDIALRYGADPNFEWFDEFGVNAPLPTLVSRRGNDMGFGVKMINRLLEGGASPNMTHEGDVSIIESAIYNRDFEVLDILFEHGAEFEENAERRTRAMLCALSSDFSNSKQKTEDMRMTEYFLARGASPNWDHCMASISMPFWMCSAYPAGASALPLLKKYGAQFDLRSSEGKTGLHNLVVGALNDAKDPGPDEFRAVIKFLISEGVSPEWVDLRGKTADEMAVDMDKPELALILRQEAAQWKAAQLMKTTLETSLTRKSNRRL